MNPWLASPARTARASNVAIMFAIVCVVFGVYARTLSFPLLWDDPVLVTYAENLVREGGLPALLGSEFQLDPLHPTGYYRPVVLGSLYLDSLISRHFPAIFHLTNIALHAGISVLVFSLLLLVAGSRRAATVGGLLFAVHPVHTESVAFISGRTDLWAMLFVLLATLPWARERGLAVPSPLARAVGMLAFWLAVLSKEASFALPGVLLLWDLLLIPAGRPPGQTWWRRNGFWIAGWGGVSLLTFLLRSLVAGIALGGIGGGSVERSPLSVLAAAGAMALRLLVVPWPLKTFYVVADLHLTLLTVAAGSALIALCAACSGKASQRAGLLAPAWMTLFYLPASGLVPSLGAVFAERFLYLPSLGVALVAGVALDRLAAARRGRLPGYSLMFLIFTLFCFATGTRTKVWESPLTLASEMVRGSPQNSVAHFTLGAEYQRLKRYEEAIGSYLEAQRLDPTSTLCCNNLGNTYAALGRYAKAMETYRACIRLGSRNPRLFANLGSIYHSLGRPQEALAAFREVLRLAPDYPRQYRDFSFTLGTVLMHVQNYPDAVRAFREAIVDKPDDGRAHLNLGLALLETGARDAALAEYSVLLKLDPESAGKLGAKLGLPDSTSSSQRESSGH